jgi:uncharacterized protein (TIGR03437 family)
MSRALFLAALFPPALFSQFTDLSPTADGSSLYFTSTLRLKTLGQPLNAKIYVATQNGVSLFRAHDAASAPANSPPCTPGGLADYLAAETSANGAVALIYTVNANGGCSYPPNVYSTEIQTPSSDTNLPGIVRLSSGGRYAIVFLGATARIYNAVAVSLLDLQTGLQTPLNLTQSDFPQYIQQPATGGRVIANDGTALVAIADASSASHNRGYIAKPGATPSPFPIADALPLIIDAGGSKVVYQEQGLYLLDLGSLVSTPLIPDGVSVSALAMSDDARRLSYLRDGQLHLLDTSTLTDRALTADPAKIAQAAMSSDGQVIFAVTGIGRLLKINPEDGSQIEWIGQTPYLNPFNQPVVPGFTTTLTGSGLSDSTINGTVPLNDWLGNVTMWIGERKVPMTQLTPTSVSFIVPWDLQPAGGSIRMLAEVPADHTPFYFPEAEASLFPDPAPRAGAIFRQDWSQTYVGPINTGEIIHVYATGFGPVAPEVPDGAAAPSAEPFSRITQPFTCTNAEILYAGLAPGTVERAYQIDIRIGPAPGYQKFGCTLGTLSFTFLTLNIVQ